MYSVVIEGFQTKESAEAWVQGYECVGEDALYEYGDTCGEPIPSTLVMESYSGSERYFKTDEELKTVTVVIQDN